MSISDLSANSSFQNASPSLPNGSDDNGIQPNDVWQGTDPCTMNGSPCTIETWVWETEVSFKTAWKLIYPDWKISSRMDLPSFSSSSSTKLSRFGVHYYDATSSSLLQRVVVDLADFAQIQSISPRYMLSSAPCCIAPWFLETTSTRGWSKCAQLNKQLYAFLLFHHLL
jgi:hypothetical protein